MKRILFYHDEFPCGGAERVTIDVAEFLLEKGGYEVFVLTCCKKGEVSQLRILELPDGNRDSLQSANYFVNVINSHSIDLFVLPIHILTHLDNILKQVHCKLIFAPHSIPLWEVTAKLAWKKRNAQKSILKRLEWYLLTYPKAKWFKSYEKPYVDMHRMMYQRADAYVTLCEEYTMQMMRLLGISSVTHKFHSIPNSEKRVKAINPVKKQQLLFVGRLSYVDKRVDRLLDIWEMIYKEVPGWELIIVGDGEERKALQDVALQKRLQRIQFVGYKEYVSQYYYDASVLCLTSTFEGWGLCLTEAQANGVVPIAFDCSAGVHEIISPSGVNGYLIPPFKKKEYAKTLLHLLKSPEKLEAIQRNVVVKAADYSPEIIGQKWEDLFNSLTS